MDGKRKDGASRYTPCPEKKTCHFIFDYNSGIFSRFLNFLYRWKQESIVYQAGTYGITST